MYIGYREYRHPLSKFLNQCFRSADTDLKKKYRRRCSEPSPRVIAKILSLMIDERHASLLALIDIPVPSPHRVTLMSRQVKRARSATRDVWTVDASARGCRSAKILEISRLTQFTDVGGHGSSLEEAQFWTGN